MARRSTRPAAPVTRPVALAVAGSDSGGGAGIQADIRAMAARGVHPTTAITAVTAQHTRGVEHSHVLPTDSLVAQYDAVAQDFDLGAVKTGMLATAEVVETVTERVRDTDAPVVVDPVMVATSGDRLLAREAEQAYEDLVAEAALVTPNADEAAVLTAVEPTDVESAADAGRRLRDRGADAALVKGGHVEDEAVTDVLVTADGVSTFDHPRIETDATHGTGCSLSSAIAAGLARGEKIETAVEHGVDLVARGLRYPLDIGQGAGAVQPLAELREQAERGPTVEAVADLTDRFVARDVSPLVPEVGLNVVGATTYAEQVSETAAIEGRITRTSAGVRPNAGVRFGASSHVARFLLGAREFDASLRFAANLRHTDAIVSALDDLDAPAVEFDRTEQPDDVAAREGSTMSWGAQRALEEATETPAAVYDPGAVGKEPIVRLLAPDADTLAARTFTILDALDEE